MFVSPFLKEMSKKKDLVNEIEKKNIFHIKSNAAIQKTRFLLKKLVPHHMFPRTIRNELLRTRPFWDLASKSSI